jgi:hypothetical protein
MELPDSWGDVSTATVRMSWSLGINYVMTCDMWHLYHIDQLMHVRSRLHHIAIHCNQNCSIADSSWVSIRCSIRIGREWRRTTCCGGGIMYHDISRVAEARRQTWVNCLCSKKARWAVLWHGPKKTNSSRFPQQFSTLFLIKLMSGWALCREEGRAIADLAARDDKPLDGFGIFGVVKEAGVDDEGDLTMTSICCCFSY